MIVDSACKPFEWRLVQSHTVRAVREHRAGGLIGECIHEARPNSVWMRMRGESRLPFEHGCDMICM